MIYAIYYQIWAEARDDSAIIMGGILEVRDHDDGEYSDTHSYDFLEAKQEKL